MLQSESNRDRHREGEEARWIEVRLLILLTVMAMSPKCMKLKANELVGEVIKDVIIIYLIYLIH